jgi:hypothetical protein
MRKKNLLTRLHINGACYIISALLLVVIVPLYQRLILTPQDYDSALAQTGTGRFSAYLTWIGAHSGEFLIYRALLVIAFALLLTLPFTLFRIIVAQELIAQGEEDDAEPAVVNEEEDEDEDAADGAMPPGAWRGKGFAVLAAWAGICGLTLYLLGTAASTIYLIIVGGGFHAGAPLPTSSGTLSGLFSIVANTAGTGLLALSTLFFGAMIARRGRNLWPGIWIAFSYVALAVAILLSASAVAVASAAGEGQAALTTPATLLFALWTLWFGIMLVRLKPE